ncbi:hypothetical protein [Streptomyces sp. NPDC002573]|uniref:hypothetical protein n=1 Tax=Streptomyces sp. NPDC002573 TaxID=3364651 RepID=UPI00369DEBF6
MSRKLEAALADAGQCPPQWGEPGWPDGRILPVRIDLGRAAGIDFEQLVLTIRLALAARVGHPLPAFDLALRRYWEVNHPSEPIEETCAAADCIGSGRACPNRCSPRSVRRPRCSRCPAWSDRSAARSPARW